ncbi:sterile alpha motif domain-containing protein 1-like [Lathamus discolor]|uniref:sterile alpha motif domain-containing protein 1-like n=1 Tax=Lathamus discolor TaxID=678569 RepID=UPI0032B6FC19
MSTLGCRHSTTLTPTSYQKALTSSHHAQGCSASLSPRAGCGERSPRARRTTLPGRAPPGAAERHRPGCCPGTQGPDLPRRVGVVRATAREQRLPAAPLRAPPAAPAACRAPPALGTDAAGSPSSAADCRARRPTTAPRAARPLPPAPPAEAPARALKAQPSPATAPVPSSSAGARGARREL